MARTSGYDPGLAFVEVTVPASAVRTSFSNAARGCVHAILTPTSMDDDPVSMGHR